MNPVPELHLQPDATARYELVDEVLAITKRAHVQKMGFVGNEYYTQVFRSDEPGAGASPAAGRDGALRAGRRGAGDHQAGPRPEDGLRRQRILHASFQIG